MALEIKLSQKLSQTLVMTPQLQQAIKLLQLGRLEYLEVIERELLENPVLEDVRDNDEDDTSSSSSEDKADKEEKQSEDAEPLQAAFEEVPSEESDNFSEMRTTSQQQSLEQESDSPFYEFSGRGVRLDGERSQPSLEATISSPEGLTSHLIWQLRTADFDKDDMEVLSQILGNLDRDGYLRCSLEEIAEMSGRSTADAGRVLSVIQTLDPPGIGARDLRECLLIQLDQLGMGDSLVWKIVSDYLPDLELRRYDVIARQEHVVVEKVYEAVKIIQKLDPRPGRPYVEEPPIYIVPDVYVHKIGDEYVISLNEAGMPRVRLSGRYQELLRNGGAAPDKEYLQEKLRSASWLIKSIHQRQQTIYRVTESIMRFQRDFLEHGVAALRPLILREIAVDVGMHESTVSRVTTNKYVHTPQGVFELKFFFSSGLRSGNGEVSSESVKGRIRELIAEENPRKPLSDQALVNVLRGEGVDIARRTVAKYREMMNILSSSRRKKMF